MSLLGHNIRGILHELGAAFELFQDQKIYLVTQAANDLNFTFVMDEAQGDRLVQQLHERADLRASARIKVLGPTWQQLFREPEAARAAGPVVGGSRRSAGCCAKSRPRVGAFVYDMPHLDAAIAAVQAVKSGEAWALRDEGQLASGDSAPAVRRRA